MFKAYRFTGTKKVGALELSNPSRHQIYTNTALISSVYNIPLFDNNSIVRISYSVTLIRNLRPYRVELKKVSSKYITLLAIKLLLSLQGDSLTDDERKEVKEIENQYASSKDEELLNIAEALFENFMNKVRERLGLEKRKSISYYI